MEQERAVGRAASWRRHERATVPTSARKTPCPVCLSLWLERTSECSQPGVTVATAAPEPLHRGAAGQEADWS